MQRDEDETGDKWVAVGKKDGGETVSLTQEKKLGWSKQDGVKIVFFFFFIFPRKLETITLIWNSVSYQQVIVRHTPMTHISLLIV